MEDDLHANLDPDHPLCRGALASHFRYLRWLDALVAWLAAWATLAATLDVSPDAHLGSGRQ